MSYYQKYRSEKVADLDLISVRSAFETMMKSGEIAHAYLFVGPRGLGKTSAARILARMVNCEKNYQELNTSAKGGQATTQELKSKLGEPCNECEACVSIKKGSAVDVMEIDAASHRGIDDIRDLREKVNLAPATLSKKVYILDEVHMLSGEAFNALLKTLEEPPSHAMFVLCTTEAHKVPETIISRTVRVNFSKATIPELMTSLRRAAHGEGLKIDDEALGALASGLDGSFREGHKLLEQLANRYKEITATKVQETLKLIGSNQVEVLLAAVNSGNAKDVVAQISRLEEEGVEIVNLVTKLLSRLRQNMREAVGSGGKVSETDLLLARKLIKTAGKIKTSPLPMLPLEMVLVETALRKQKSEIRNQKSEIRNQESGETLAAGVETVEEVEGPFFAKASDGSSRVSLDQVVSGWSELLSRLQPRNHSVAGLLRSVRPVEVRDGFLTLEVFYKFHKDQLDQDARRRIIEEEIAKLWGPISVRCVLGQKPGNRSQKPEFRNRAVENSEHGGDDVAVAQEVFGV